MWWSLHLFVLCVIYSLFMVGFYWRLNGTIAHDLKFTTYLRFFGGFAVFPDHILILETISNDLRWWSLHPYFDI